MLLEADAELRAVEAEMNYMEPMAERPYVYTYTPPDGTPGRNGGYKYHKITIRDARPIRDQLSLDVQGFGLVRQPSAVKDFYDSAEVEAVCYPETAEIVRRATGAQRATVFDHTIRRRSADRAPLHARQTMQDGVRGPVGFAHNDYTPKSAPQRIRDLMGDEAEDLLTRRYAYVNLWRPIHGPVLDAPLGLCDWRSLGPNDMVATDLMYPDRVGEVFNATFSPSHQWFYFPEMRTNEAVLIKCYDTREDGTARWSLHSAFEDPTTPPDAPPRESIELRAVVFFDA